MGVCSLCTLSLEGEGIVEGEKAFCCPGCRVVFSILSSKGEEAAFRSHPIFVQALQAGLISNPALLEEIEKEKIEVPTTEREKAYFGVAGLWCPSCAEIIRLFLLREKGVLEAVVDYSTDLACVEFSPRHIGKEKIFSILHSLGYQTKGAFDNNVPYLMWARFGVAAFFSLNIMMLSYPLYATWFDPEGMQWSGTFAKLSLLFSLPVVLWSAFPIWQRLWNGVRVGIVGMELLVFMGTFSAMGLSLIALAKGGSEVYFDAMTTLIAFLLLGKIVESKAKRTTKEELLFLSRSIPQKGKKRFDDGSERYVSAKEFKVGDLFVANGGEKIVLDGTVVEGEGGVDEACLTGEPLSRLKVVGDTVSAGTVVRTGLFVIRATSLFEESGIRKILDTVQQTLQEKTARKSFFDRLLHVFIPLIFLVATVVWVGTSDPVRTLAVLMIGCPCAIGIAAPLAEAKTIGTLASLGALVRRRDVLEVLGAETVVVFDKTGTLTEGRLSVVSGLEKIRDRALLKGLALRSNHPVARAVQQAIDEVPVFPPSVIETAGKGIAGGGLFLGSARWMEELGFNVPDEGRVFFACGGEVFPISLEDRVREGAREAVKGLRCRSMLLSGDSEREARRVAAAVGIEEVNFGVLPLEKRALILRLQNRGERVMMVGDGINDAAALSLADVGVAMARAEDISVQSSALLLTGESLDQLEAIRKVGRFGRKIVRQNLFWACIYNVLGIPLAAFGWLSPLYAAFSMTVSSLIVIVNSRREGGSR